ncbi:MobC family plasmid mobilization relaxosome protein [Siccirubricoccus phaeus]|uniref:MobC family plasmid mobilization relaxosome protein n=1 Tax=Siccirubricoccus phaeus TaxID=2595053 RepID=UPI0011F21B30|nr:MobC family plasmid mobilization relaxosome protein [Siccirubricoccus phaeus]
MARPKKAPAELKDDQLKLRLTAAEHAAISRTAGALGLTTTEFVRRRALGYRLPPPSTDQQALASLAAALIPIGNNLNQLTRAANAGRLLPQSIEELATRITALLDGFYGPGDDEGRPQL